MAKYRVQQNDQGRYCIHEMQGDEMGEAMSCHDSEETATARMREMMAETRSVKVLEESDTAARLGGWAVVYGGEDLTGETFTKETDFWLKHLGNTKPLLYDHGFDGAVKLNVVGEATLEDRDDGLWFEAQVEKSNRYASAILKLAKSGVLGASSGAVAHLVRMDGNKITSWPLAELSLTVQPAEPRTLGVAEVRALLDHSPTLKSLLPEDGGDPSAPAAEITVRDLSEPTPSETHETENTMPDINELAEQVKAVDLRLAEFGANMDRILKYIEDTPAIRSVGYVTQDGGTADKQIKSFGDFLMAIKRHDVKRLASVYGSVKDMTEGDGTAGGYTVPEDQRTDLLRAVYDASPIVGLCTRVPVGTAAGTYPALDQFAAPTAGAGNTAYAAGVTAAVTAEGGTLTETTPAFMEISWRVYKRGGYTLVSNELVQDSATSIEQLLRSLFAIAIASRLERDILRGTGNAEPMGILNADCKIAVTTNADNTFAWVDAWNMMARFKPVSGSTSRTRWIMHNDVLPDLAAAGFVTGNVVRDLQSFGFGGPVLSEHMIRANGDDVLLADLGAYLLFVRDELSIAYSEHANFTADKGTWRFTQRVDGQPWLRNAITLADPTGSYTVGPFVFHDD